MREEKAKDGRRRRKTKPAACQSKGVDNDSFEMEECKRPDSRPEVPAESLQHMHMEESPRQHKPRTRKSTISSASAVDAESASVAPDTDANENEVVGIVIHRTDQLRATADVRYAMVRVHVMNEQMGTYYLRQRQLPSSGDRKWSQFIQPVWCAPIELLQGPAKLPVWEELLFINEQYGYIADTPSTVLLFELLNIRTHPGNLDLSRCTQAEHRVSTIAWAFLRLVGANGHTNTGLKKQRLQLFEPVPNCKPPGIKLSQQSSKHGTIKKFPEPMAAGQHLFDWWSMGSSARIKYPSTLYVTVKKINIGQQIRGSEFSVDRLTNLTNLENAGGQISKQSLSQAEDQFSDFSEATIHRVDSELWRRSPDQPCRIPNEFIGSGTNELLLLPEDVTVSGSDARTRRTCGSHAVKFSPNGKWIAVGSASEAASGSRPPVVGQILSTDAPVFVYKHPFRVQSATPHLQLAGHTKIVYSVDWSPTPIISQVNRDSKSPGQMTAWLLASASADGTVRVWWLPPEQLRGRFIKKDLGINPIGVSSPVHVTPDDGKAVTGETSRRGIFCTVLGHPSFVYSAQFSPHPVSGDEQDEQTVEHILATAGFDQIVRLWKIGQLKAEASYKLTLYYVTFKLRGLISAQLLGGQNYRELLRSCISPCGSFVFSGAEDHNVYVWSAITGDQVACYRQLQFSGSVKSISFHPTQHVVVFASLDREQPVCVYAFNPLRAARIREAPFLQLSDLAESKSVLSTEETSRLDRIHVDKERRKATRIRRALAKLDSVKVMRHIPFVAEESLDDL
ncbi:unnamed protein product, partial [Dicrocoelium dendriticum]